ncbi:MAG: LytTR family DNA-binding domain-containing protein [Pedobacter sp.]|nr:LytTR family DNA-binding domain-containing protein [Pedobacter sp.]MDQ8051580.1 LytTR family DNA-binding domain-containing protein [Pedobacter sp.]
MFKCIIIDDDQHAISSLEKYIEAYPVLELVGSYTDPLLALNTISRSEPVDLILLDIDMPKINGLELSREIRNKTDKLVFTTSHVKYGYEAFKVNADDYLLKPFTQGEFMIAMSKIFADKNDSKQEFFFVKNKEDNHKMVNIKFKDVVAVESKLNYVLIHTTTKQVLTYMSLNEISKMLSRHTDFVQFHRSFIISHPHIDYFDGKGIRMDNGLELTVGQYYRKSYNDFIAKHLIRGERK